MKKAILPFAAMWFATTVSAGVHIETLERDIKTKKAASAPSKTFVQNGNARIVSGSGGAMLLKGDAIYIINDAKKNYRVLDTAAISRMQERMANMPPKQREMMARMMGGKMPGGPPAKIEAQDTGKNDSVDGRSCRMWNIRRNGIVEEDLCVVPFATLPGKEDFQATFKKLGKAYEGVANDLPGVGSEVKARGSINGYAVRTRGYVNGTLGRTEKVLKSWVVEPIPQAMFEVPAGYTKASVRH